MTVAEGGTLPTAADSLIVLQWGRNLTVAEGCGCYDARRL